MITSLVDFLSGFFKYFFKKKIEDLYVKEGFVSNLLEMLYNRVRREIKCFVSGYY